MSSISVIVPTFNRGDLLPETIDSLLRQTLPPTEIIIVDDGSTDDTEAVCRAFPSCVRYVRQKNAGVSAARNNGVGHAVGEWIALADSDDPWEPNKLEIQMSALAVTGAVAWSLSGCTVIDMNGEPLPDPQGFTRVFPVFKDLHVSPETFFGRHLDAHDVSIQGSHHRVFAGDAFELFCYGNVALPSSALLNRRVFERVGLFNEAFRFAEETEFFHRVAAAFPVAVVLSPLVKYRSGENGALTSPENTTRLVNNALLSLQRASRLRDPLTEREREALQLGERRLLLTLAYAHLSTLHREAARLAVREAWAVCDGPSLRSLLLYGAALLPSTTLRTLHAFKRALRR